MANLEAQIKPTGMRQGDFVDLLYGLMKNFHDICAKLDADDNADNTYEASSFAAVFNGSITNTKGATIMNAVTGHEDQFYAITPTGLDGKALLECLYQLTDIMRLLCTQCDEDDLTTSDYLATLYTAPYLWNIENCKGSILANAATAKCTFRVGAENRKELIDMLYMMVKSQHDLCAKLDTDAKPAGADYEKDCYTANITIRVENSTGNITQ